MNDNSQNQGWMMGGGAAQQSGNVINLQGAGGKAGSTSGVGAVTGDPLAALKAKYQIPEDMQKKYPVLIELVLTTESMTDDERQYWFQIMPVMSEDQLLKFQNILETEKKQLQRLDQEYEEQLKKLNGRHQIEWKEFETREKRKEIEHAEKSAEKDEKTAEENLLQQLDEA